MHAAAGHKRHGVQAEQRWRIQAKIQGTVYVQQPTVVGLGSLSWSFIRSCMHGAAKRGMQRAARQRRRLR